MLLRTGCSFGTIATPTTRLLIDLWIEFLVHRNDSGLNVVLKVLSVLVNELDVIHGIGVLLHEPEPQLLPLSWCQVSEQVPDPQSISRLTDRLFEDLNYFFCGIRHSQE